VISSIDCKVGYLRVLANWFKRAFQILKFFVKTEKISILALGETHCDT
jgi:hypothetical protein